MCHEIYVRYCVHAALALSSCPQSDMQFQTVEKNKGFCSLRTDWRATIEAMFTQELDIAVAIKK